MSTRRSHASARSRASLARPRQEGGQATFSRRQGWARGCRTGTQRRPCPAEAAQRGVTEARELTSVHPDLTDVGTSRRRRVEERALSAAAGPSTPRIPSGHLQRDARRGQRRDSSTLYTLETLTRRIIGETINPQLPAFRETPWTRRRNPSATTTTGSTVRRVERAALSDFPVVLWQWCPVGEERQQKRPFRPRRVLGRCCVSFEVRRRCRSRGFGMVRKARKVKC